MSLCLSWDMSKMASDFKSAILCSSSGMGTVTDDLRSQFFCVYSDANKPCWVEK